MKRIYVVYMVIDYVKNTHKFYDVEIKFEESEKITPQAIKNKIRSYTALTGRGIVLLSAIPLDNEGALR